MFTGADAFLVPISLGFGLGTDFWTAAAAGDGAPLVIRLLVLVFLIASPYLLFGRFIAKRVAKRHTCYILTDHRAVIVRPRLVLS